MASEPERIEEVRKYIEATITETDSHTEDMEKLFKMDRWRYEERRVGKESRSRWSPYH